MSLLDYYKAIEPINDKWWYTENGNPLPINIFTKGYLIGLMHSELSEALEGERKDKMDDKLPHRKMVEVELVDCLIRILDYGYRLGYDLEGAFWEKLKYNENRQDHKEEAKKLEKENV